MTRFFSAQTITGAARKKALSTATSAATDIAVLVANASLDDDDAYPEQAITALNAAALLTAPFDSSFGGIGLGSGPDGCVALARSLMAIGGGNLPLGRLFEGHVNAVLLIQHFGTPAQIARAASRVAAGELLAVWNTEPREGVRLHRRGDDYELSGRKCFASGAGHIRFPLITAGDDDGDLLMVTPTIELDRADLTGWMAQGMRASASGNVDFDKVTVRSSEILGGPDDFHRQPIFSAGAWRFSAVQAGGIARLFELGCQHLRRVGRTNDPHQQARMASAALAVETARLWVEQAARLVGENALNGEALVAYVNLARSSVERAGLDVLELVLRSVGLQAFMRTHPIERFARDLQTYLRQPNPDKALTEAAAFILDSDDAKPMPWT